MPRAWVESLVAAGTFGFMPLCGGVGMTYSAITTLILASVGN
jgi:hypothetical protein